MGRRVPKCGGKETVRSDGRKKGILDRDLNGDEKKSVIVGDRLIGESKGPQKEGRALV